MAKTKDYSELDTAILEKIASGQCEFAAMSKTLADKAKPHCGNSKSPYGNTPTWRVIDRRLQALRKAGKITYSRSTGWSVQA